MDVRQAHEGSTRDYKFDSRPSSDGSLARMAENESCVTKVVGDYPQVPNLEITWQSLVECERWPPYRHLQMVRS